MFNVLNSKFECEIYTIAYQTEHNSGFLIKKCCDIDAIILS